MSDHESADLVKLSNNNHQRWPTVWPGVVFATLCGASCLTLWALLNGDQDLTLNIYPEILLAPVFIHWIYIHYRMHSKLRACTAGSYPISPVKAAIGAAFTGPLSYWLGAYLIAIFAQMTAALFANASSEFERSLGLIVIVGGVIGGYTFMALLNFIFAFTVYGKLGKFKEKLGLKGGPLQRWLVGTSLACPALWQTVNTRGDYSAFLLFVVWQSAVMILSLLSIRSTFKQLDAVLPPSNDAVQGAIEGRSTERAITDQLTATQDASAIKLPINENIALEADL